jgi:uncharacterized membrane protein (UPF0182 family)
MQNRKRLMIVATLVLLAPILILAASSIPLIHLLVDYWWFSALDYEGYFWLRLLYRYILSGSVTLFFFLVFFFNFWVASRYLGAEELPLSQLSLNESRRTKHLLSLLQTGSFRIYAPLSLILAITIALPFYTHWEEALLFIFGPEAGVLDPVYQEDVSFYLFRLPIFDLIQVELQNALLLLSLSIALLYWIEHKLVPEKQRSWAPGAKMHLSALVLATAFALAWGYMLHRHDLLYVDHHEPVFFGPGFVEGFFQEPLLWFSAVIIVIGTVFGILYAYTEKGISVVVLSIALFLISIALEHSSYVPEQMDRFIVKPNPVKAEHGFMEDNIIATQDAYYLQDIKTVDIAPGFGADALDGHTREHLHNIPVWDTDFLDDVYQEMQGIRPYYNFTDIDVARYTINGSIEQVNLATREINLAKLPSEAQNWENRHLRYTHGYGAVVTPSTQNADEPMKWLLRDINMQSDMGFSVEKPDIYYGTENLDYAIVPNLLNVVDIASYEQNAYSGQAGISISSLFRKLVISGYFRDEKLFFSVNIDKNSHLLMRRNIVERVKTLTPFLALDNDPYPVVTPQRIYWIQDAYTTSEEYPVSKISHFTFAGESEPRKFNYIRNSVKVVIDAFDGTVSYYISNPADPVIQGYSKAFPGLFKDIALMSPLLKEQLRYPEDLFNIRMSIYAKYHQTDPALFYQQAETWDFSNDSEKKPVKPYYLTTYLQDTVDDENFILLEPMTPIGRSNLSALAIAGNVRFDSHTSPIEQQIVIYKFDRQIQIDGPSQISALIDQDSEISKLFSLWDQKGSHVIRGRILTLPVGKSVLYVQPIYLVSTGRTKIPELARVILSMGNVVAMDTSLEKAYDKLEAQLKAMAAATPKSGHEVPGSTPSMHPLP